MGAAVAVYCAFYLRSRWRLLAFASAAFLPALLLSLIHNHAVTGRFLMLPYMLSQYQYGIPTTFTFERPPQPHLPLTPEQQAFYRLQLAVHGTAPDSLPAFLGRLGQRLRFVRFFVPVPLLLSPSAFLWCLRHTGYYWLLFSIPLFAVGTAFYPYFYPHYIAATGCLWVLAALAALQRLAQWHAAAARLLLALCGAQFVFRLAVHVVAGWPPALELTERFESWDYVNHGDPEGRLAVARRLEQAPGKQLVFVRYAPVRRPTQWIWNAADIDRSRIVRALDLGAVEDEKLLRYYPDRTAWLLEPDVQPPRLTVWPGRNRQH